MEPPEIVRGDAVRLRQILINLVGNASKFTEQGSISVSTTVLRVNSEDCRREPSLLDPSQYLPDEASRLPFCWSKRQTDFSVVYCHRSDEPGQHADRQTMEHDRLMVIVEVADTGIGISKETGGKLFDKFQQADERIGRRYGGTGLGLSIVKRLTQLLMGDIVVASKEGLGSSFFLCFSLEAPNSSCEHCALDLENPATLQEENVDRFNNHPGSLVSLIVEPSVLHYSAIAERLLECGSYISSTSESFVECRGETSVPFSKTHQEVSSPSDVLTESVNHRIGFYESLFPRKRVNLEQLCDLLLCNEEDPSFDGSNSPTAANLNRFLIVDLSSFNSAAEVDALKKIIKHRFPVLILAPSKRAVYVAGIDLSKQGTNNFLGGSPVAEFHGSSLTYGGAESLDELSLTNASDEESGLVCAFSEPDTEVSSRSYDHSHLVHVASKPLTLKTLSEFISHIYSFQHNCLCDKFPLFMQLRTYFYPRKSVTRHKTDDETANASGDHWAPEGTLFLDQEQTYEDTSLQPTVQHDGDSIARRCSSATSPCPLPENVTICEEGIYISTGAFFPKVTLQSRQFRQQNPLRAMVVDDSQTNLQYMCRVLDKLHVSYEAVCSSHTAIERLRMANPKFDMLFVDLNMPELDGLALSRYILLDDNFPSLKRPWICAVTASVMLEDRRICAEAGISYFIPKPFGQENVTQALSHYMRVERLLSKYYAENQGTRSGDPDGETLS